MWHLKWNKWRIEAAICLKLDGNEAVLIRLLISNDRAFKPYDPLQSLIRHITGNSFQNQKKKILAGWLILQIWNMIRKTLKFAMYSVMFGVFKHVQNGWNTFLHIFKENLILFHCHLPAKCLDLMNIFHYFFRKWTVFLSLREFRMFKDYFLNSQLNPVTCT